MEINKLTDEIKKANIEAMKQKDTVARNIYSVVLNKIMLENIKKREVGEQMSESDVLIILQKCIKELEDERENYRKVENIAEVENIDKQIGIVKTYLPQMMSESEIREIMLTLEDKSIGNVMKYFKTNYAGKCDMRLVGDIQKSL